jgi:hypothetical protein
MWEVVENYVSFPSHPPRHKNILLLLGKGPPIQLKALDLCLGVKVRTKPLVEGYARWIAHGGKPGPAKWTGGRPRKNKPARIILAATPEERRQYLLETLNQESASMTEDDWVNTPMMREVIAGVVAYRHRQAELAEREAARKPHLAVDNDAIIEETPPRGELTLVHDADQLANDLSTIGQLAMARIKDTLAKPFDPADSNYAALLRFTSGVYNSTMTTMLRADENLLRARTIDRLPELLNRVAEEERKRGERQTFMRTLTDHHPSPPDDVA